MLESYQVRERNSEMIENRAVMQQQYWDPARADNAMASGQLGEMETGWDNVGFFDEFGGGFGMGINQFLSTQITFGYES